ncbi:MAG TPA: peptidylprolyl isomerase, partial [Pyrinomonadaceae bacterium]|nr:peptidylprolyl isomerase [Pyrinomonadaceae bacterium]
RAYYDKNKSKFTKQETVSLSELFLSFAGRDEAAVRQKAKDLVAQLRSGADFAKLVVENSDRPNAAANKGKGETVPVKELDTRFVEPLKNVGIGGYTDPVETTGLGVSIIRVDDRQAASNESEFKENAVRIAMLQESFPEASKKFLTKLRSDSYIKISDTYRPLVSPILFADERKEKTAN